MSNEIDLQTIKNLLVRIRTAKHLAQSDVTSSMCTQGMLSKIETSKTSPSFLIVANLLSRMNVSLQEFEYLYQYESRTKEDILRESLSNIIDTYQFFLLHKHQQVISFYPNYEAFLHWLDFCFGIELSPKLRPPPQYQNFEKLLNQDEFFNADYYPIIYHLIFLPVDAASYNYTRLLDQTKHHPIKKEKPFIVIDASITLGAIFYKAKDYTNAYHYFYIAYQKAMQRENISRLIICQIILSFLAADNSLLQKAAQLTQLFSKDIFFNYWYNVLYRKFNEV